MLASVKVEKICWMTPYVPANWHAFGVQKFPELCKVPNITHQDYVDAAKARTRPLVFFRTPHILHKGALGVTNCTIVQG